MNQKQQVFDEIFIWLKMKFDHHQIQLKKQEESFLDVFTVLVVC